MVVEIDDPSVGKYKAQGNPMRMDLTPVKYDKGSPLLGENTDEVLTGLGYSVADPAALKNAKAI